jgi:hypothetical protein
MWKVLPVRCDHEVQGGVPGATQVRVMRRRIGEEEADKEPIVWG